MRPFFFLASIAFCCVACNKDVTCSCSNDAYTLDGVSFPETTTVSTCINCSDEELEIFEASCMTSDEVYQILAEEIEGYSGSCTYN